MRLRRIAMVAGPALAGLAVGTAVLAQSGTPFTLAGPTVTGGGGTSTDQRYRLTGVVGQPAAGSLFGFRYSVETGSVPGGPEKSRRFIPAIARD